MKWRVDARFEQVQCQNCSLWPSAIPLFIWFLLTKWTIVPFWATRTILLRNLIVIITVHKMVYETTYSTWSDITKYWSLKAWWIRGTWRKALSFDVLFKWFFIKSLHHFRRKSCRSRTLELLLSRSTHINWIDHTVVHNIDQNRQFRTNEVASIRFTFVCRNVYTIVTDYILPTRNQMN